MTNLLVGLIWSIGVSDLSLQVGALGLNEVPDAGKVRELGV